MPPVHWGPSLLSRDFQLELMANRQDSRLVRRGGLFEPENRIADVALTYYQVGGLWDLGGRNLRPFIVLGIGGTTIKPDIPGVAAENRFSSNLGAGAKFFATPNIGLRIEARGYWKNIDNGNGACFSCYDNGSDFYQVEGNVGLILRY